MAGKEADKWEKHMGKKPGTKTTGPATEIHRPTKKKPIEGKKVETKEKKAVQGKTIQAKPAQKPGKPQVMAMTKAKQPAAPASKAAEKKEAPSVHKAEARTGKEKADEHTARTRAEQAPVHDKSTEKQRATKQKSRKVIPKRSDEVLRNRDTAQSGQGLPTFRGRFGKRNIRRKSIAKWNRWRVPRGIDVKRVMSDGYMPRTGYSTPSKYRHIHPSGYREFTVRTLNDLASVPKDHAVRISAGIGSRKKVVLVDKAIESGLRVLNP